MIDTNSMRDRILALAMKGRLTSSQNSDTDIDLMYNNLISEKEKILEIRGGRVDKNIKKITEIDRPYEIPKTWKWIRLGEVGLFKKGPFGSALTKSMFVPEDDNAIKVYEQQHAINKDSSIGTYYISRNYFEDKMCGFEVKSGDIIVSCAGTIGETYILPKGIKQGIINQALMRITLASSIFDKFFVHFFNYGLKKSALEESNGSAIKNIPPFEVLKNWCFPLVPIEEQKRIVEKIEELFDILDNIDKFQRQYISNQEILKSKIIDAGIRGELTEQLPEDGTAEELYQQIQEEKEKLIKEKKIKKTKPLPEITEDEIPFEIPESWKWCRLGEIYNILMGQSPDGTNVGTDIEGMEFHQGKIFFGDKFLKNSGQKTSELTRVADSNSVLLCVRAPVGVVNITERQICIGRGLCAITALIGMEAYYLFYYLLSCRKYFEKCGTGSTFSSITVDVVKKHLIPLPPQEEQKRIVEIIDRLFKVLT